MCDQAPSKCKMSIKVVFLNNPEQKDNEEEWYGYQYYLWLGFTCLSIFHGERNKGLNPDCPVCQSVLLEIKAGLYCYNDKCPQYKQKVVACCEGGFCWTKVQQIKK